MANDNSASAAVERGKSAGEQPEGQPVAFFEYWNPIDMVSWMGARIVDSPDGHATVYFEPGQHHRGAGIGGRAVTGAVQAYIFDIVTGAAVASLAHGTKPQVTVTLDVTFEHPPTTRRLPLRRMCKAAGSKSFFVEGDCRDVNGPVCSRATPSTVASIARPAAIRTGVERRG